MQTEKQVNDGRTLTMLGREKLSLSGVEDVVRFDEEQVICRTALGELILEGTSLRITSFSHDLGTLVLCGEISGFYYDDKKRKTKKKILWGTE